MAGNALGSEKLESEVWLRQVSLRLRVALSVVLRRMRNKELRHDKCIPIDSKWLSARWLLLRKVGG